MSTIVGGYRCLEGVACVLPGFSSILILSQIYLLMLEYREKNLSFDIVVGIVLQLMLKQIPAVFHDWWTHIAIPQTL